MNEIKPSLPLRHREIDSYGLSFEVTHDADWCELTVEEVNWINERLSQPTISDYLEANEEMIEKTKCKVVTIESLRKFGGLNELD